MNPYDDIACKDCDRVRICHDLGRSCPEELMERDKDDTLYGEEATDE